jgi:hypothetical protein
MKKDRTVFLKRYHGCDIYYVAGRDKFMTKAMNLEIRADALGSLENKIREVEATRLLGEKILGLPVIVRQYRHSNHERWVKGTVTGIGRPRYTGGPYCLRIQTSDGLTTTAIDRIRVATVSVRKLNALQRQAEALEKAANRYAKTAPTIESFKSAEDVWKAYRGRGR